MALGFLSKKYLNNMSINISHSIQQPNRILILALIISLFAHALFVLLSQQSIEMTPSASSSRMNVAINWREHKTPENKTVEVVKKQEQKQAKRPEKNILKSTKKTHEQTVLADKTKLDAKPNKVIEKKTEPVLVDVPKAENKPVIQKPKQELVRTEAESRVPAKISLEKEAAEKKEDIQQVVSDTKSDTQESRFQIGSNDNPKPSYPSLAVKRGWQGEVILGVHVRPDGSIEHLTFVKSTNYGVLNFEAYETVRTSWHFKALDDEDEHSETTYIEVPITFNIANR